MESVTEILRILQVVLGIGLVIFVHELGHFLAARLTGVRVEVFSIGFGPRLFSWRRGGTLYQIAALPIGGYVRMAGEDRRADGLPPAPDDICARGIGARFFIYSGGILANVLFGLVVFPILFAIGVPFPPPILGQPDPGGPAWRAGLAAGTEIVEVNGGPVFDFLHIPTDVALGGSREVELLVRDPESQATRTVVLQPERDEQRGIYTIGITPALETDADGGIVLDVLDGSPAQGAGIRTGERLVGLVDATPGIPLLDDLSHRMAAHQPVEVQVVGEAGPRRVRIEPQDSESESEPPLVGIAPPRNHVVGVRNEELVARFGLRQDDRIERVGDVAILGLGDLSRALLASVGEPLRIAVRRAGRPLVLDGQTLRSREQALALHGSLAIARDVDSTRIVPVSGSPAERAGLLALDRVLRVDSVATEVWADVHGLIQDAVQRGGGVVLSIERPAPTSGAANRYLEISVRPQPRPRAVYGLLFRQAQYVYKTGSLSEAILVGTRCSWNFVEDCWLTIQRMVSRQVPAASIGGPIAIGTISYSFAASGWAKLFFFLCLLSINLAFINLLPIPILDGGHLLFLIVEKVKGSPVSDRVLGYSQMVGLVLILSLMVFVTYNDLVNWVFPER